MKTKDLSTDVFLRLVNQDIASQGYSNISTLADRSGIPRKIIQAKLKKLIKTGIVDGCACGCDSHIYRNVLID